MGFFSNLTWPWFSFASFAIISDLSVIDMLYCIPDGFPMKNEIGERNIVTNYQTYSHQFVQKGVTEKKAHWNSVQPHTVND